MDSVADLRSAAALKLYNRLVEAIIFPQSFKGDVSIIQSDTGFVDLRIEESLGTLPVSRLFDSFIQGLNLVTGCFGNSISGSPDNIVFRIFPRDISSWKGFSAHWRSREVLKALGLLCIKHRLINLEKSRLVVFVDEPDVLVVTVTRCGGVKSVKFDKCDEICRTLDCEGIVDRIVYLSSDLEDGMCFKIKLPQLLRKGTPGILAYTQILRELSLHE